MAVGCIRMVAAAVQRDHVLAPARGPGARRRRRQRRAGVARRAGSRGTRPEVWAGRRIEPGAGQAQPCRPPTRADTGGRRARAPRAHFDGPQDIEWAFDHEGLVHPAEPTDGRGSARRPSDPVDPLTADRAAARGRPDGLSGRRRGSGGHGAARRGPRRVPGGRRAGRPALVAALLAGPVPLRGDRHRRRLAGRPHGDPRARVRRAGARRQPEATQSLEPGDRVTVDATREVFAGILADSACAVGRPSADEPRRPCSHASTNRAPGDAALADRSRPAAEFTPERCRSLHDVTRYVHEKAFEVMFHCGDIRVDRRRTPACWRCACR